MIIDMFLDLVGHRTSRWLLPILTFGTVKVDGLASRRNGFNWLGFQRLPDGSFLCSGFVSACLGILFWALVFAASIIARERF